MSPDAVTPAELLTEAERSNFERTGRTDEVEALCAAFERRWPEQVRRVEYGRSAQGRPLRAMVVSRTGTLTPRELRAQRIPVLMIQAGIHPGESDGKDAGFMTLRAMLQNQLPEASLQQIAILFVPAFNTDGHERFGRWNRPNQRGPEETGWRTTSQNLNLNRDYSKADTCEMRAMLRLIDEWDPLVCVDLHVTDGADFEPDVSIQVEPLHQGEERLRTSGRALRDDLIAALSAQGSLPLPFYPDLARTDDPSSGFVLTMYSPRFSTGYFPQRNRWAMLVETHSWKPYAARLQIMQNTIATMAQLIAACGPILIDEAQQADEAAVGLGGSSLILDYTSGWREPLKVGATTNAPQAVARTIDFRGYAYTRERSEISGDWVTIYDPATPQIWRVPYRDEIVPSLVVNAPRVGYVIPVEYADDIGGRLANHGVRFERLDSPCYDAAAMTFRATGVGFSGAPFEGRTRASLQGSWTAEPCDLLAGALFVPIAQTLARLMVSLLEPQAPDSFAAWGFFNACFEQKEQVEPYVAEQIAREMLAADPSLQAEFARRLNSDAAFAADPSARLEFFLRRHSSWDQHHNLYPVLRLEQRLPSVTLTRVASRSA